VAFALAVMKNIDMPAQKSFFRLFFASPFILLPSFPANAAIKSSLSNRYFLACSKGVKSHGSSLMILLTLSSLVNS
jgi:hypothetical protein